MCLCMCVRACVFMSYSLCVCVCGGGGGGGGDTYVSSGVLENSGNRIYYYSVCYREVESAEERVSVSSVDSFVCFFFFFFFFLFTLNFFTLSTKGLNSPSKGVT